MTTFIIVSFGDKYIRYKNALIRSIEANVKGAKIKDIELDHKFTNFHTANYIKLQHWIKNIEGNSVLIDADTIVLEDVSEVFNMPHDLIYTKRDYNRSIPFNSGVVFVKESGKHILDRWCDIDQQMFTDPKFHQKWKKKYFGFNQASFGCLLETMPELNIGQVNATIYNSCDRYDWKHNYNQAKIVHVKSDLRLSVDNKWLRYQHIENRIKKYYI
jgi:hypothetical protein